MANPKRERLAVRAAVRLGGGAELELSSGPSSPRLPRNLAFSQREGKQSEACKEAKRGLNERLPPSLSSASNGPSCVRTRSEMPDLSLSLLQRDFGGWPESLIACDVCR